MVVPSVSPVAPPVKFPLAAPPALFRTGTNPRLLRSPSASQWTNAAASPTFSTLPISPRTEPTRDGKESKDESGEQVVDRAVKLWEEVEVREINVTETISTSQQQMDAGSADDSLVPTDHRESHSSLSSRLHEDGTPTLWDESPRSSSWQNSQPSSQKQLKKQQHPLQQVLESGKEPEETDSKKKQELQRETKQEKDEQQLHQQGKVEEGKKVLVPMPKLPNPISTASPNSRTSGEILNRNDEKKESTAKNENIRNLIRHIREQRQPPPSRRHISLLLHSKHIHIYV